MTMLTSSGYSAISAIGPTKVYQAKAGRGNKAKVLQGSNKYDSVTLSTPNQDSRFHMGLVSRVSQEVRTSTTTGDIAALRQQVASGEYTPDPMAIAARILFLGEDR